MNEHQESVMILISETFDKVVWYIFRAINLTWAAMIVLAVVTGWLHPLKAIAVLLLSIGAQHLIIHTWNYGFHRRTVEELWEERYDKDIATRDKLNRRATIMWMLGFKKHALMLIEHADYAWLQAQLVLADEDNPRNGGEG
jgi:hypothetical protein